MDVDLRLAISLLTGDIICVEEVEDDVEEGLMLKLLLLLVELFLLLTGALFNENWLALEETDEGTEPQTVGEGVISDWLVMFVI